MIVDVLDWNYTQFIRFTWLLWSRLWSVWSGVLMSSTAGKPPILTKLYHDYLAEEESASFILAVSRVYTTATLERLSRAGGYLERRAAVLALGFLGGRESATALGRALRDPDRGVRMLAESGIRDVWLRYGGEAQRHQLRHVIRLNGSHQFSTAITEATWIIDQDPTFGEAWNQRAIAKFFLGQYQESIDDCNQTLQLIPYHFGAAAGMAQCYLELDAPQEALECFEQSLKLNPALERVRAKIASLKKSLEGR